MPCSKSECRWGTWIQRDHELLAVQLVGERTELARHIAAGVDVAHARRPVRPNSLGVHYPPGAVAYVALLWFVLVLARSDVPLFRGCQFAACRVLALAFFTSLSLDSCASAFALLLGICYGALSPTKNQPLVPPAPARSQAKASAVVIESPAQEEITTVIGGAVPSQRTPLRRARPRSAASRV